MINRCNVVLGRGDGVNMSDEKRNQIYGQARFFRAYTMFVLLRLYGTCYTRILYCRIGWS